MEVLILVCALSVPASDCRNENAEHVLRAPAMANAAAPATCMREGMLYAAQSGLVGAETYVKVVCRKPLPFREAKRGKEIET